MTSHYRNTTSIVYLLFCLFITYVSASSIIRQYTDDFNTNLQQENGGPNSNLGEAHNLSKDDQEMSSRDYKVSVSTPVKGLRDRPPSTYSLKMESFSTLLKSNEERYESRPFAAGGYNWKLVVYPNGNEKDNGSGYLSLYVAIDNSTLVSAHQEVYADLRFYIFNKKLRTYATVQDTNAWKFTVFKTMWGFSSVISVDNFKDPKKGYLYDRDHCEFGVDVIIPTVSEKSELFSVTEYFYNPIFTWKIQRFSTLFNEFYVSRVFSIGGRSWTLQVYPSGHGTGEGKFVSIFLSLDEDEKFRPYEKIYVRATFRVLNQRGLNNVETQIDKWYNGPGYGAGSSSGRDQFISLASLRDSSKGFLVNDILIVQVKMEAISSTTYFPS